jgi:DNA polymerase-1
VTGDASILLVDALNLFTRHYVAHPALGENGNHVGGIVGFLNEVKNMCFRFRPKRVYVVWEGGGSSRRRALYPDYKGHRRPERLNRYYENDIPQTVSDRNDQIAALVKIMKSMPICQMYAQDCEADDVIAYICRYLHADCLHVILSADKDYYQLIRDNSIIYSPTWKKIVDTADVINRFGAHPNNFALAKSICGDDSDNIPGVSGVGFKTLSKRFPELLGESDIRLDQFMELARQRQTGKVKVINEIVNSNDLIARNWQLVHLDTASIHPQQIAKITHTYENWEPKRDKISLVRDIQKIGVRNFDTDSLFYAVSHIGAK